MVSTPSPESIPLTGRALRLHRVLSQQLAPLHLDVINESHGHSVAPGSETHFKVVAVSALFEGRRPVARHQLVYQACADELNAGLHALALHLYTPEEWQARAQQAPASPACLGGSKH
jgi:BolA family transcriptional regulator, general stress-responsive regulator